MKDYLIDSSPCPVCGLMLDGALAARADSRPNVGDLSVCAYCAAPLRYGEGLRLELIPDDEWAWMVSEEPELARVQGAVRDVIEQRSR